MVPILSQMRLIIFTHCLLSIHFNIIVHCTSRSSLPFLYLAFSYGNSEAVVISPMRSTLPACLNLSVMNLLPPLVSRYSLQHRYHSLIGCCLWVNGKILQRHGYKSRCVISGFRHQVDENSSGSLRSE